MTETAATRTEGATRAILEQQPPRQRSLVGRHSNVEVHIPAEASPVQIDHIFSSMARHIRPKATGVGAT